MTELGKRLKEARETKKISLDELQHITKIQKRYLIGIEEGNYTIMPGNFYVRAFIKQYAEAVGLDPEEIFHEYAHEIPSSQQEEVSDQLSRVKSRQRLSLKHDKWLALFPKLLIAAVIVGVAVILWMFLQRDGQKEQSEQPINTQATEVERSKNSPLDKAAKAEKEKQKQQKEETKNKKEGETASKPIFTVKETKGNTSTIEVTADQLKLEATSKGASWFEVFNGKGHSFYKGTLRNGQTQTFDLSAESEVFMKIGRTLDVDVKINGQPLTYPIDPKEEVYQKIKIVLKKP
ncbi:helix-turn-helix domain-containing protein [Anoxybacteroides tepidamans]|uniref:helix-turn-helix domain-containing protein n=1 Tax=Anoxybacteroides tepidamans TaxID=265948 RepID=UPI00048988F3|nr:helix-turn-helix domain-containing protein [Anoxybacillus tepidamans]